MDTTDFKIFFPFETASATANCAGRWVTPANEYDFFRINNTEIRLLRQWLWPLGFNFRFGVLEDVSDVEVSISCSNAQN